MSDFDTLMHFDDGAAVARPSKALWSIDLDDPKNDDNVLTWLNGEIGFLIDAGSERGSLIRRNIQLYRGIQYDNQDVRRDLRDRTVDRSRTIRKIVVNHLFDLTQARISRLVKFRPAVAILPTNNEFEDKQAADSTDMLLKHLWYINEFDAKISPRMAKIKSIMGEAYLWIDWDSNAGDIHPENPKKGTKVPLLTENGEQETDDMGNKVWIERDVMTGDVRYQVVDALDVYVQDKKGRSEKPDYCFRKRILPVEEARLLWPKAASKIKSTESADDFDHENFTTRKLVNEVIVWEFYHRGTIGLPKGRKVVFTRDGLLENGPHPFSHKKLPYVRLTDIDIPGLTYGMSFFETVKALTSTYNNLTNLVLRNQILVSHPKWMVPAGSCNLAQLGNDVTIVQYKGPQAPVLAQANPTPTETFQFRENLKEEFQTIAGVRSTGRADPPAGIKSGVALQFLNEQEQERANEDILKWNEFIKDTAIMTIAVAGDFYDTADKRLLRVLGKDNEWKIRFFDSANLSKDYDIRIQNSSALPQSKAARTQTLLDLNQQFPDIFSPNQVLDMLDLAQNDKFVDQAANSVRSAQAENELLLAGDKTAGVTEYEDHVAHWKEHVAAISKYSFKELTPPKVQKGLIDHIMVHEMLLWQKAKLNPAIAEVLVTMPRFPIFFKVPTPEPSGDTPAMEPPQPPGGPLAPPQGLPVNPALGDVPQQLNQESVPPLEIGAQGPQALPAPPPPVPPSDAI